MFSSIRANHFLRWELRRSSTPSHISWSFILIRVIPLTFLTLVVFIPVYFYIDDSRLRLLPIMAIILYMPRPILTIRTIFVGIHSIRQDIIQGRWEPLILTGIPARKIVRGKWLSIVTQNLPDQILFSLPAIGLALGISQFFQTSDYCSQVGASWWMTIRYKLIHTWLQSYCYNSDQAYFAGHLNPSVVVTLIGIILIIVTAFMEAGLNASIGLLAGFSQIGAKGFGILYGAAIRLWLALIIFLSIAPLGNGLIYTFLCPNFVLINVDFCPNYANRFFNYELLRVVNRAYDTFQLAFMSLFDQGTLLAANVMRPNDDRWMEFKSYYRQPERLTYVRKSHYDNRPFVFRNLIAAVINCFFYFLLIRHFLRRATRFAIVNHGASGYLEL